MIEFKNVKKSYNGKVGCMCGCQGKYYVASHYGVEQANKDVGYEAYETPNDRAIKLAVKKINDNINWNDEEDVRKHVNNDFAYVDINGRRTAVYFNA